ncbi:MAG TPA: TIGR03435 family protein [Acidobacteriaceae bacterium]|nr:TIGR03435 family protein [Acidobacteriaceae bacterium]
MTFSAHSRALACLVFTLGMAASAVPAASAQTDTTTADAAYVPTLTFDVVSIHESKDDLSKGFRMGGPNSAHASLVSLQNYRANDIVATAYGLDARNVSGGPDWASSTRFYMEAKSDHSVDDALAKLSDKQGAKEKQHMLQVMLADRFQLKVHQVVRDATVYDLIVAKGGTKLKPSAPAPPTEESTDASARKKNSPMMRIRCGPNGCEATGSNYSMQSMALMLNGQMTATVTDDKTGLSGLYDFTLQWSSDNLSANPNADANDNRYPSLFTAVKEQLGLELKPVKGTIVTLVIDHIEKPSEN